MDYKGDAWTTVLEIRNELFFAGLEIKERTKQADKYLLPILKLMEEEGIKVNSVSWGDWWKFIQLIPKQKLNETVYNYLCKLAKSAPLRTVENEYIYFSFEIADFRLRIDNGDGSCKVTKITKQIPIT